MGQTLFIRSTKKVQLTPEGEILFKHIEPAMNLIQKGENQLLEANSLNGGQLRIAASDTICRYYLVPYLNRFHKAYPNVHIKVFNFTSIECAHVLENGQVDFILSNYPNSGLLASHSVRAIHEFHDVFVANAEAFPLTDQILTLEELKEYPILHSMFQRSHLDLVPEIELSSNDLLIDLARIGLGIAFVPDFCIPADESQLYILKLAQSLPARKLVVASNGSVPLSQAAKQFMDML